MSTGYMARPRPLGQSLTTTRPAIRRSGRVTAPPWIKHHPRDMLHDTAGLAPAEALAYRTIFDRVAAGDELTDDDQFLGELTQAGKHWRQIKARLVALGKIIVARGRVTIGRAQEMLAEAGALIAHNSQAGKNSAQKRAARGAKKANDTNRMSTLVATSQESQNRVDDPPGVGSTPLSPPWTGGLSRSGAPPLFSRTVEGKRAAPANQPEAGPERRARSGPRPERGPPAPGVDPEFDAAFGAFCVAFPNVVELPATRRALFESRRKAPITTINAAAELYAASLAQDDEAPMNSANWLARERWNDRPYIRPPDQHQDQRVVPFTGAPSADAERRRRLSPRQALFAGANMVVAAAQRQDDFSGRAGPDFDPGSGVAAAGR